MRTTRMDITITKKLHFILICFVVFIGSACADKNETDNSIAGEKPKNPPIIKKIDPNSKENEIKLSSLNWAGNYQSYLDGVSREVESCKSYVKAHDHQPVLQFGNRKVKLKNWCIETGSKILELSKNASNFDELLKLMKSNLEFYRVGPKSDPQPMKVTGYHFPTIEVREVEDSEYKFPIYKKPNDLVLVNVNGKKVWRKYIKNGSYSLYDDRANIDRNRSLKGKNLEIAYAKDLLAVANLQVEGAGALQFVNIDGTNGKRIILNYSAQNGRQYVSIRRILKEKGVEEKYLTAQGQKKYFQEHPEMLEPVLYQNPSYVFFTVSEVGPLGATNTVLTNSHSIAIDKKYNPLSAFAILNSEKPKFDSQNESFTFENFSSLVITQDVGGAIAGFERIDYYFGDDLYAELASGVMNQKGELILFLAP